MAGAWAAADVAAKDGADMAKVELMSDVSRYNEIDCLTMAQAVHYLRRHH